MPSYLGGVIFITVKSLNSPLSLSLSFVFANFLLNGLIFEHHALYVPIAFVSACAGETVRSEPSLGEERFDDRHGHRERPYFRLLV